MVELAAEASILSAHRRSNTELQHSACCQAACDAENRHQTHADAGKPTAAALHVNAEAVSDNTHALRLCCATLVHTAGERGSLGIHNALGGSLQHSSTHRNWMNGPSDGRGKKEAGKLLSRGPLPQSASHAAAKTYEQAVASLRGVPRAAVCSPSCAWLCESRKL